MGVRLKTVILSYIFVLSFIQQIFMDPVLGTEDTGENKVPVLTESTNTHQAREISATEK